MSLLDKTKNKENAKLARPVPSTIGKQTMRSRKTFSRGRGIVWHVIVAGALKLSTKIQARVRVLAPDVDRSNFRPAKLNCPWLAVTAFEKPDPKADRPPQKPQSCGKPRNNTESGISHPSVPKYAVLQYYCKTVSLRSFAPILFDR